jgi:hypothetical protein
MNKTFTAAIAITAVAGLASADIATDPAGYIPVSGSSSEILVCNPFNSFSEGATTLRDIDGSELGENDTICIISTSGKKSLTLTWQNKDETYPEDGWYVEGATVSSNDYPLARGTSILFKSPANKDIVFAGPLAVSQDVEKPLTAGTYAPVGNISIDPDGKTLGDFEFIGCDYAKDYIVNSGTKYVYYGGHWYSKADFLSQGTAATKQDSTPIDPCGGIAVVCGTAKRGLSRSGLSIKLPGTY